MGTSMPLIFDVSSHILCVLDAKAESHVGSTISKYTYQKGTFRAIDFKTTNII